MLDIMYNDYISWGILNEITQFQKTELEKLVYKFNDPLVLLRHPEKIELITTQKNKINNFINSASKVDIDQYQKRISELIDNGVSIIPIFDDRYPQLLKLIDKPPLVIYAKGSMSQFEKCVAIAGSRNLSHYGHKIAREISREIAKEGYIVVSGLARGTDTEAHCGALDVGGRTIAVLPNSIANIYPDENERLSQDIMNNGALISESAGIRKLQKYNFVERNRITSGMSIALLLIESSDVGGTAHQFKFALKQKKPVFALKPREGDLYAMAGHNKFVKEGATSVEYISDIVEMLTAIDKTNIKQSLLMFA